MRVKLILLGTALLAFGLASLAQAEIVQSGNVRVSFDGKLTPKALPRQGAAPVNVAVDAEIGSTSEAAPPQLRQISIAINRFGRFTPQGLPVCSLREIQPSTTANALEACRGALVGEGQLLRQGPAGPAGSLPGRRQGLCLQRQAEGQAGDLRPRLRHRSRPHLLHPAVHDRVHQGHLRHDPPRRPARRHRQLRLHHRPLAQPRSQLQLPRPAAQLPERQLPGAQGLPRRRLSLCQGQLRLWQEDPHLDADPQLQGRALSRGPRPSARPG